MASEFGKLQSLSSPMQQRKRLSQISGLLTTSIDNSPITDDQDDAQGILSNRIWKHSLKKDIIQSYNRSEVNKNYS